MIIEVKDTLFQKGMFIIGKVKQEEARLFCKKNNGKLFEVEIKELKH